MDKSLLGALPIYAQHLSEATGVKVVVNGNAAYTTGKTVVVPFVKNGDAQLSFGYIAHECSHVRNSDMGVVTTALNVPMRKRLLNVLEDIRIERLSMDQYPGTEDDIRYLNRKVLLEPYVAQDLAQAPPLHILHNALLYGAYWKLQEPQLEAPAKAYLSALVNVVGQPLADQIMDTACRTLQCANTGDVLVLVDEILAMLPSQEEQKPDQPQEERQDDSQESPDDDSEQDQNGDGDADNSSEESGSQSDSTGSSEPSDEGDQDGDTSDGEGQDQEGGTDSESEQTTASGGSEAADDGSNQDQGASQSQSAGQGQAGDTEGNDGAGIGLREMAMSASEDDLKGLVSDVGDAAGQHLTAQAKRIGVENTMSISGRTAHRNVISESRSIRLGGEQSAGLRQVLTGLLQAKIDCRVRLKRQGRRIDTGRIAMLKAGETRIFRSKARAEKTSASIQFLLDKSASMREAIVEAEAALYAVLAAMDGVPLVSTGAISFPEAGEWCALIKSHNERLPAAVQAGGFGGSPGSSTPLGAALWSAAVELLSPKTVKSDRKILFVITDGQPDDVYHAKSMVLRLDNAGIEVIGLGFGGATNEVLSAVFRRYSNVGTVSNLRSTLFELVRGALAA